MDRTELFVKLQDLLASEFDIERDQITSEALLYDDLGLDSIDAVDIMAWVVKLTDKRMQPESFKNARTVGDVIDELEKHIP